MIQHAAISDKELRSKIREGEICLGGNGRLKIYGTLRCPSGKRLKRAHRVFFACQQEALDQGFRPCGNCMKDQYQNWKYGYAR